MDTSYPLIPIANFLAVLLVLISLSPSMFRSWKIGVYMFAFWVAIQAFKTAVNAIVWADNANNVAPVWCDITSHIQVGAWVSLPACSFVITRRLSEITRMRGDRTSKNARIREIAFDYFFCIGLPVLSMSLYYIVQSSRFRIVEEQGCGSADYFSGVSMLIIDIWPIVLPVISIVFYCPRIIWTFYRHRREVNEFLGSRSSVSHNSYYRVLALGCLDITITLPFSIIQFVLSIHGNHIVFWPGWETIHADWKPVLVTKAEWAAGGVWNYFGIKWSAWVNPAFAVIFFLLFGTTQQARARYRRAFWTFLRPFGIHESPKSRGSSGDALESMNFQGANIHSSSAQSETFDVLPESEKGWSGDILKPNKADKDARADDDSQDSTSTSSSGER